MPNVFALLATLTRGKKINLVNIELEIPRQAETGILQLHSSQRRIWVFCLVRPHCVRSHWALHSGIHAVHVFAYECRNVHIHWCCSCCVYYFGCEPLASVYRFSECTHYSLTETVHVKILPIIMCVIIMRTISAQDNLYNYDCVKTASMQSCTRLQFVFEILAANIVDEHVSKICVYICQWCIFDEICRYNLFQCTKKLFNCSQNAMHDLSKHFYV